MEVNVQDVFERGNDSTKHNPKVKAGKGIIVYCREDYAQDLYDKYENGGVYESFGKQGKDLSEGEVYLCRIDSVNEKEALASTEEGQTIFIDVRDEYKKAINLGMDDLSFEVGMSVKVVVSKLRDSFRGSYIDFNSKNVKIELYDQIEKQDAAYLAKIESVNRGGYIVDISGVKCFLPGSLAAANKIIDFESYVGNKIYVMVDSYMREKEMFIVSYKKYLKNIMDQKIQELDKSKKYSGNITGVSNFGIFVEWDEFYTGLIHKTEIEKIGDLASFKSGDIIDFYVKEIKGNNRITLSLSEPTNTEIKLESIIQNMGSVDSEILEATIKQVRKKGMLINIDSLESLAFIPSDKLNEEDSVLVIGNKIDVIIYEIDQEGKKIFAMSAYE